MSLIKKDIMFFMVLLVLTVSLFGSTACAQSDIKVSTPGSVTKSSAIPAKREFPVNESVNPCVNFYEYACSPVIDSFELREDRSRHVFSFSDSNERLLEFKKKYFLDLSQKDPETAMEGEIKNYYLACMNEQGRQKEELELVKQTKEMLDKITTREEFINMVATSITDSSQFSFINFSTDEPNLDRPNYNDLFFDTSLRILPEKSYYENEELAGELKSLIKDFFINIGEKKSAEKADLVFNFGKGLAQVYPTPPEIHKLLIARTEVSREKLIKDYPNLKLKGFFANIPKHVVIRNIIGDNTMGFLNEKLKTASLEELKSVYLYFRLRHMMDDAYLGFFNKKFEFNKKYFGGPNKRPDRQERCTYVLMDDFEKEVDFILLPKLFPNFPKEKFIKSIEKIRASLLDQLKENSWLAKDAKQEAMRKIATAKLALVSPNNEEEWDFNPRATYSIDNPIANSFKLGQLLINKNLKELEGPANVDRWKMGPLTVNAYCDFSYNKVVFPIGILQYPFYDPNEPEEINLGAIGAVIGHELGHAIDDNGSSFNADGVLKAWLTDSDKEMFGERTKPLIAQFDKISHNGKFTLGENIGDLVGLTTAYSAAFPPGSKKSQDLKKKFFLQFARAWCGVERDGVTKMRLKTDPHSLEYARTNEPMKNMVEFKEAYNCKPTDPMVLPEKDIVKIW